MVVFVLLTHISPFSGSLALSLSLGFSLVLLLDNINVGVVVGRARHDSHFATHGQERGFSRLYYRHALDGDGSVC